MTKILILDIETAPTAAYVWGMWDQNVAMNQIIKPGYILSYAAKWLGAHEAVTMQSLNTSTKEEMLQGVYEFLNEADVVIHYNGKKFDIPTLNREFILMGLKPPSGFKQIDLLPVVRQQFKFPHNKLDYVAKALGVGGKLKHAGFDMWIGCMHDDPASWEMMEAYNVEDVRITEALYLKILPWIPNHPNMGLFNGEQDVCPNCGGKHLEKRGFSFTAAGKYQRFQCKDCGAWSRSKANVAVKPVIAKAN
jgi:DNA polymerase elongation subunit (family B)